MDKKIRRKREQLRARGTFSSNCYEENLIDRAEELWESEASVLFSYNDHGIKRLVYFVQNSEELGRLLPRIEETSTGGEYVLEFLTRDENENREILESSGFSVFARMKRMSNPDCRSVLKGPLASAYSDNIAGVTAACREVQEIHQKLWSIFDTRISHLPDKRELLESIEREEVEIHRDQEGKIDAILQTVVQPRKFYINQVYNSADKSVIHAMLIKRLKAYAGAGGKYMYAWVEENNIASCKFHQKYGMKHDGMWDMIYVKKG